MTEVDLFISTKAVKVLNADTQVSDPSDRGRGIRRGAPDSPFVLRAQETMMDSALRTISYIADIGSIVVLMARRRTPEASPEDFTECPDSASDGTGQHAMICYVFESEDVSVRL